ncbi:MAG: hypothetical protein IIA82_09125 [Thaumarchaeota archaeon]|nr:hypothetical protein [Nitrososphaerota archaeon]
MVQMLQVLVAKDGKSLSSDEVLDGGFFDSALGYTRSLFLRNATPDWICDITGLDTVNTGSSLYGPELIMPLQTAELKVHVKPVTESIDNFDFLKHDPTPIRDSIAGDLVWKRYEITSQVLDSMRKNQIHMKKLGKDGLFNKTNSSFQKSGSK